jgi:acyl dehydratase
LRFLAPVKVGSRIRAVSEIVSVEEIKGAIQSVVRVTIEIEDSDKPALRRRHHQPLFPEKPMPTTRTDDRRRPCLCCRF